MIPANRVDTGGGGTSRTSSPGLLVLGALVLVAAAGTFAVARRRGAASR